MLELTGFPSLRVRYCMLDLTRIDDAVYSEGGISRRLLLAYGAALAAVPSLGRMAAGQTKAVPKFKSTPFTLGVASGEPYDTSVVLWTRLAPKHDQADGGMPHGNVEVVWVVANDYKMKDVVQKGTVSATAALGHSVHVVVQGLKPDRWYWYQFRCGGFESTPGHTRTLPTEDGMPARMRFAIASCQNYEDGLFTAYEHMAHDSLDLVFHLGDYIYEGGAKNGKVRQHVGAKECKSLTDYRLRHCQYRHDSDLRRIHARCPWIVAWDDHEVENDYANATSSHTGVKPEDFLKQRAAAYQAYYEMMPLRPRSVPKGHDMRLYRSVKYGKLAIFRVLDTRQYRTGQPNGGQSADINFNSKNTLLGKEQWDWLQARLLEAQPLWNVLAQQVMMGLVDHNGKKSYSMDQWPGYAAERKRLLQFLADRRVSNPVVLSGDIHSNWVNDLRVDDRLAKTPVVATEFVGTSISSKGNGHVVEPKKLAALQAVNPCVMFHNDERGYVRCTVTEKEWTSEFQVVSDVTKPGGTARTRVAFVVEAGKPGVTK